MTLEKAVFYRRMLSVGLSDTYQTEIECAIEQEALLSGLLLDLALCLSDINKTISVLDGYIAGREADEEQVYEMLLSELRKLYLSDAISLQQAAEALLTIQESESLYCGEGWSDLLFLSYEYDDVKDGYCSMEDFLKLFLKFLCPEGKGEAL